MTSALAAAALAACAAFVWFVPRSQLRTESLTAVAVAPVRRRKRKSARRSRDQLARQAPVAIDLIAALLDSGAPPDLAIATVAQTLGDPIADILRRVALALALGSDPAMAWSAACDHEALEPLAAAMVRSSRTGAPLTNVLLRAADDARREQERTVQIAARSAGVRSVGPLAACFLPAFLLVGVVPVVASLAGELL